MATDAGLGDAIRVTLTWARGRRAPEAGERQHLRNALAAARNRATVYVSLYPFGSTETPLSDARPGRLHRLGDGDRAGVPQARHFIIGNEPNLNRFWLPQFGPSGEDVAAPAYVSLLAGPTTR